jgi:hypothetical protein
MMDGGAFILLKRRRAGPESTQQAENRVAVLRKILQIVCFGATGPSQKARGNP